MTERVKPATGLAPFFMCPCSAPHRFMYGHLAASCEAGPWYCDACGVGWRVHRICGEIEISDSGERKTSSVVTLRLPPQQEDIVLTIEHSHITGSRFGGDKSEGDHHAYFFEEHTCPTNIMHSVIDVRLGDDADPHGLFEFVSCDLCERERGSN